MYISRSEAWDSAQAKPAQSSSLSGKGCYIIIFQALDQSPRHIGISPTKGMILYRTSRGSEISIAPYCGSYDPQRSRVPQPRANTCYHFLPLHITDFERSPPEPGQQIKTPSALTKRYSGGGYLLFDASSRGRSDLLSTLYCTGYEQRPFIRKGDIVLAELRLSRPEDSSTGGASEPSWKRFFSERHASLHMSKRGMDAVFTGKHVNMAVPNAVQGNRYSLTPGQAQEIIISLFATSIMTIEHESIDRKWTWLLTREALESSSTTKGGTRPVSVMPGKPATASLPTQDHPEKYSHLTVEQRLEHLALSEAASFNEHPSSLVKRKPSFDQWKVVSYDSLMMGGDAVLREARVGGGEGFSPTDSDSPRSDGFDDQVVNGEEKFPHHFSSPTDDSESKQAHYVDERPSMGFERMESVKLQGVPMTSSMEESTDEHAPSEQPRQKPKEGPKVTGKPKLGEVIYW
ncbi:hypothetical protein GYMLUDRAFT_39472 [Collybiopsis luxurians FD-317 M1]|nr:hypothetical protein GYMLUDRAFT_39472 [Collybiopsis luxurians FD-317 M1]